MDRRRFLGLAALAAGGLAARPALAKVHPQGERKLAFYHLHTGEKLSTVYWADGKYLPGSLAEINHLLRDFRTGTSRPIDPKLLDLLHKVQRRIDCRKAFHIISAYRSPASNGMLRTRSSGVAKRSLHMEGKAIDIRLPGCRLGELRRAALSLQSGGVGYYPESNFVHVDTGSVRSW
jgi:uncharacterized protein YcbK (DUF882 family)